MGRFEKVLAEIAEEVEPLLDAGEVADYIPQLSCISPKKFGMAVHCLDGDVSTVGDADEAFSIQSISKVFTLTMAMRLEGDRLWRRLGREPSGTPFNSLVQLEHEHGIPRNPFINAGALVITDVVLGHLRDARQAVLDFVVSLAGECCVAYDESVARSEAQTGHRNAALAHFLKSFDNLNSDANAVLDAYFHHCSITMSCVDLARACLYLASSGMLPPNMQGAECDEAEDAAMGERVLSRSQTKYVNSLLLTCGTYDAVGDFAYRVGLPGKSGVGGGIVAVMPGQFSVCVWSPGLNSNGNSLAGTKALELFTTKTGISIF